MVVYLNQKNCENVYYMEKSILQIKVSPILHTQPCCFQNLNV